MHRSLGWLLLAMLTFAPTSHAAAVSPPGVNLRWDNCYGDGDVWNKNFACDTNSGSERLVCSFELDQPIADVFSVETILSLSAASATLPAWWEYRTINTCRQTSLAVSLSAPGGL